MPESCEKSTFFNTSLKGKYAYWVHMRYIVSFSDITLNDYISYEENINLLTESQNISYLDTYNTENFEYIDFETTNKINDIYEYEMKNSYTTDEDITMEEIKKFRTWLATELLNFNISDNVEKHILNYYKHNMVDSAIDALLIFGATGTNYNNININKCGCSGTTDLSSLYNSSISICDPISIYRKNIYNKMVEMFSNIDFWKQLPPEFILTFKHYIDNIIKTGLPLQKNQYISSLTDCACVSDHTQSEGMTILNNLSQSLQYIYDNNILGHKNYIKDALYNWSSILYEDMYWN